MRLAVMFLTGTLAMAATATDLDGNWNFIGNPALGVGAAYVGDNARGYLELSCDVTGSGLDMLISQTLYGRPLPEGDQVPLILIVPDKGTYSLPFHVNGRNLLASLADDHPLVEDLRSGIRLELHTATGDKIGEVSLSGSKRSISQLLEFCDTGSIAD
ncbi:MAG: hypothetical protein R3310_09830 [Candidatus Competibacteraceae bacterium]|nr:hypothetical protein [Candidatus Competibacteraceae bacterium]